MRGDDLDREQFWFKEKQLGVIIDIMGREVDGNDEKMKYIHREFSIAAERFRILFGEDNNKKIAKALGRAESLPVWLSRDEIELVFEKLMKHRDKSTTSFSADCWACAHSSAEDIRLKTGKRTWEFRTYLCSNCGDKRCPRAVDHNSPCSAAKVNPTPQDNGEL